MKPFSWVVISMALDNSAYDSVSPFMLCFIRTLSSLVETVTVATISQCRFVSSSVRKKLVIWGSCSFSFQRILLPSLPPIVSFYQYTIISNNSMGCSMCVILLSKCGNWSCLIYKFQWFCNILSTIEILKQIIDEDARSRVSSSGSEFQLYVM